MQVFVIRNQHLQYLDKQQTWSSGKDSQSLYRAEFHDDALNTLIELNAKDIDMRGNIIEVELDEKRKPVVEVDEQAIALDMTQAMEKLSKIEVKEAKPEI